MGDTKAGVEAAVKRFLESAESNWGSLRLGLKFQDRVLVSICLSVSWYPGSGDPLARDVAALAREAFALTGGPLSFGEIEFILGASGLQRLVRLASFKFDDLDGLDGGAGEAPEEVDPEQT